MTKIEGVCGYAMSRGESVHDNELIESVAASLATAIAAARFRLKCQDFTANRV